jgi:hypothetical protein
MNDNEKLKILIEELEAISNVHIKETITFETVIRLLGERDIFLTSCDDELVHRLAKLIRR